MEIKSIRHKSLYNFVVSGSSQGLPGNLVGRLRNMLAYLAAMADEVELTVPPNFGAHQLKGDRAGEWSLTVTKNWRMVFRITRIDDIPVIENIDLEDYH